LSLAVLLIVVNPINPPMTNNRSLNHALSALNKK